jgi:hypothetical protein
MMLFIKATKYMTALGFVFDKKNYTCKHLLKVVDLFNFRFPGFTKVFATNSSSYLVFILTEQKRLNYLFNL